MVLYQKHSFFHIAENNIRVKYYIWQDSMRIFNLHKHNQTNSVFKQAITQKQLKAIIYRAFGRDAQVEKITEIKFGRFNTTYKLKIKKVGLVVLRVAPSPDLEVYVHEKDLLKREHSVHPFISNIGKYSPKILFADFTRQIINRDYEIQSFIEGLNWDRISAKVSKQQNVDLWNQLSNISGLITQTGNTGYGLPEPRIRFSTWKEAVASILGDMICDLEKYSLNTENPKKLHGLINADKQYLHEIIRPELAHGDLWPKNVLLNNGNGTKIVGILDSERAFWGDPKSEWIIIGKQFAGKKSKDSYVFRCGLFSADYAEIPEIIAQRYISKNVGEFFRQQIYLGIYLTQRMLESQRFPRNEKWIEEEFNNIFINLGNI